MHTSIYVGAYFKTSELDYYPLIISPGSFAPTFTHASWGPADNAPFNVKPAGGGGGGGGA